MTTPAMGLALPTPSLTNGIGIAAPGQSWGEQYNSNFTTLDTHTHAPGSGTPVPTAGIAINADLTFAGFNATNLRTTQFSGITLGSLGVSDRNCLLASSGDLYFVDGSGNQVRITSSGGVAGTPGAITGLASPAAVTYTVGSKLFTFTSSSPRVAGIACGPLSIGDASVDNGKQVTISAPAGLVANYALKLPTALPGAQNMVTLDNTGALSTFGATFSGNNLTLPGQIAGPGFGGGLTNAGSTPSTLTPAAGWTATRGLSWYRDSSGLVHMRGGVNNNTGATSGNPGFSLPVGARPITDRIFGASSENFLGNASILISASTGNILFSNIASGAGVSMDVVCFQAEQ